jgi:hypothetical protein
MARSEHDGSLTPREMTGVSARTSSRQPERYDLFT